MNTNTQFPKVQNLTKRRAFTKLPNGTWGEYLVITDLDADKGEKMVDFDN